MAEIKKYLDTTALGTLVDEIKKADAATLTSAQGYADGLAKNYDAAGAASTAKTEAIADADAKFAVVNENVANKADTTALEAEVTRATKKEGELSTAIDGVDAKADKNAEDIAVINNEETGILKQAKDYADAEDAKIEQEVADLEAYVGTFAHDTAKTIVEYVNAKTDGIATSGNLEALGSRVTAVEGDVATIKGDYLKSSDKTELEGKINAKADQTALDEVSAVANAAATNAALEEEVNRAKGEESRIEGLVTAEAAKAREEEGKLDTRLGKVEAFFELAEGESLDTALDTLVEIQEYITNEGTAADQMLLDIAANTKAIEDHVATDHDFAGADAALKAELEGKISAKADASAVTELSGKVTTNEQAITALQGADTTLSDRIDALEGAIGESGSVADDIATAKQESIDAAASDATTKAGQAESNAKAYTDTEVGKDRARLDAIEAIEHHTHSNKTVLDGITAEKVTGWDNAAAKAHEHSNKTVLDGITSENVTTWNTVTSKAAQTDLDNAVERIAANEGAISTLNTTVADKAEQDDLDAAVERIAKNETDIASLTSSLSSFTPITSSEVMAMFA